MKVKFSRKTDIERAKIELCYLYFATLEGKFANRFSITSYYDGVRRCASGRLEPYTDTSYRLIIDEYGIPIFTISGRPLFSGDEHDFIKSGYDKVVIETI